MYEDHAEKEQPKLRETTAEETALVQASFQRRDNLLRRHVLEALNNANDDELHRVLQERYHNIPEAKRVPQSQIIESAARFLDLAHLRLDARLAIIYLALAAWDYESAVQRYMAERYDELDSAGVPSEVAHEPALATHIPSPTPLEPQPNEVALDDPAEEGSHDATQAETLPQRMEFTFRDICPCNLDGHKCMLPRRCRFIRNAICTLRVGLTPSKSRYILMSSLQDCQCYGKIHLPPNCQSLRDNHQCVDGGYPRCYYGHDFPGETGRTEQAGIHAAHHLGEL